MAEGTLLSLVDQRLPYVLSVNIYTRERYDIGNA